MLERWACEETLVLVDTCLGDHYPPPTSKAGPRAQLHGVTSLSDPTAITTGWNRCVEPGHVRTPRPRWLLWDKKGGFHWPSFTPRQGHVSLSDEPVHPAAVLHPVSSGKDNDGCPQHTQCSLTMGHPHTSALALPRSWVLSEIHCVCSQTHLCHLYLLV